MKQITDYWGPAFVLAVIIHIAGLAFVGQGALGEAALKPKTEYLEVELAAPPVRKIPQYPAESVQAVSPNTITSNDAAVAGVAPATANFTAVRDQNVAAPVTAAVPGTRQITEVNGASSGTAPGTGVVERTSGAGSTGTGSGSAAALPSSEQEVDSRPYAIYSPSPEYPSEARFNKWQGRVIVRVLVEVSGKVADARVAQSSGYDALDQAAEEVLYSWRFNPAHRDGQAVAAWVKVPVSFTLTR
jgi:protein TonB